MIFRRLRETWACGGFVRHNTASRQWPKEILSLPSHNGEAAGTGRLVPLRPHQLDRVHSGRAQGTSPHAPRPRRLAGSWRTAAGRHALPSRRWRGPPTEGARSRESHGAPVPMSHRALVIAIGGSSMPCTLVRMRVARSMSSRAAAYARERGPRTPRRRWGLVSSALERRTLTALLLIHPSRYGRFGQVFT